MGGMKPNKVRAFHKIIQLPRPLGRGLIYNLKLGFSLKESLAKAEVVRNFNFSPRPKAAWQLTDFQPWPVSAPAT